MSNIGYHLEKLLNFLSSDVTSTSDYEHKFSFHAHREQQACYMQKYIVEHLKV